MHSPKTRVSRPVVPARLKRAIGQPITSVVGVTAVLYMLAINSSLYYWGDDAHYMIVAEALSSGDGFRDILFPGEPEFAYPAPLFPLLLAPIVAVFGFALVPPKTLVLLAAVAAVYWSYRLFRSRVGDRTALVVTVMVAVSPQLVSFSHQVMTEIPYLLISLVALFWVQNHAAASPRWLSPAVVASAALLLAAILMRSIGFTLLFAAIAYIVVEGDGDRALRMKKALAISLLCAVAWFALNYSTLGRIPYVSEFREGTSARGGAEGQQLADRIRENVDGYFDAVPEVVLYHLFDRPVAAVSVVLLLGICVGFVWAAVRRRSVIEYYAVSYAALLLLYPPSNSGNLRRYLVPLIPFIIYYFVLGVRYGLGASRRLARRYADQRRASLSGRRVDGLTAKLGIGVVAIFTGANLLATTRASVIDVKPEMFDFRRFGNIESHWEMARWARHHTPAESIVATPQPYPFYFWSRRRVTWPPAVPTRGGRAGAVKAVRAAKVDYVALDDAYGSAAGPLPAVLAKNPADFIRVYHKGPNAMYRVVPIAEDTTHRRSGARKSSARRRPQALAATRIPDERR